MRRSVERALEHWRSEGLLNAEQVEALAASLEDHEEQGESGRAVAIYGSIGAVLAGLGALLFVASNWAGMSPTGRLLVLLAAYGTAVGCAVLAERRGLPRVAEAVWLLATLVLGANIFLLAQTYNLSLTLWQGTFAWMVGALALGWARQSAAQAAVAVPLGILTLGWAGGGSGWFFDDQVEFLFADGGLRPLLALVGLGLVALSTLLARRDELSFARAPCFWTGIFMTTVTLVVSTAHVQVATELYDATFSGKQIAIIVATVALVVAAFVEGEFDSRLGPRLMAAMLGLFLLLLRAGREAWMGMELGGLHPVFGLYVIVVLALALLTIWLGIEARRPRLVNLGMSSMALLIVIQYFGWSFQLLDRSLAFVLGGLLLIGLSVAVERKRRQVIARLAT